MKNKRITVIAITMGLSLLASISAFAGQWIYNDEGWQYIDHTIGWNQDSVGWWYQKTDGSYPTSTWQWIDNDKNNKQDGEQASYYFDANGYLVTNTTIDGYTVNADGAWIVDGVVQVQLTEWKQAQIEREKENETRTQRKEYYESFNPYLDNPEYQIMREEMFAELKANIEAGKLNPTNIVGEKREDRSCSVRSESIVYSSAEKPHYWDIAEWVAKEIIDYLYDTYGWEYEIIHISGIMANNTIGDDVWNPILDIELKVE